MSPVKCLAMARNSNMTQTELYDTLRQYGLEVEIDESLYARAVATIKGPLESMMVARRSEGTIFFDDMHSCQWDKH